MQFKNYNFGFPWWSISKDCFARQGTLVWSLVQENHICLPCTTSTEPMLCSPQPKLVSPHTATTEAHAPRPRAAQQEKPTLTRSQNTATKSSPLSPQPETACTQQQRPTTAKTQNKYIWKHTHTHTHIDCYGESEKLLMRIWEKLIRY